jgi:uncharacterized membrane protein YraQ (UPF0718 family)
VRGFSDAEAGGGVIPILAHGGLWGILAFYGIGGVVIALIIGIVVTEVRRRKKKG